MRKNQQETKKYWREFSKKIMFWMLRQNCADAVDAISARRWDEAALMWSGFVRQIQPLGPNSIVFRFSGRSYGPVRFIETSPNPPSLRTLTSWNINVAPIHCVFIIIIRLQIMCACNWARVRAKRPFLHSSFCRAKSVRPPNACPHMLSTKTMPCLVGTQCWITFGVKKVWIKCVFKRRCY